MANSVCLRLPGDIAAAPKSLPLSYFNCDTVPSMKAHTKPLNSLSFLCLAVCLFLGPMAIGEEPGLDLDDLAKRFSKQIEKAGIASIVVADFVEQDGTDSTQGRYLADEFAQRLEHHRKKFVLIGRKQLSAVLSDAHLSAKDLATQILCGESETRFESKPW